MHPAPLMLVVCACAGKTSLVRDIARVLAEQQSVCIVDTSNEIAGEGDTVHHSVGKARRMMVSSLNEQARIMVECVQVGACR
jgi:stage III sporulation protein SpoIIIAA